MRRKVVLASGVFDLLHPAHVRFLREAKKRGGKRARLVVVIARDRVVEERKGRPPSIPEAMRRELVAALKPVDRAILGYNKLDYERVLKEVRPDIVAVGYDQDDIKKIVERIVRRAQLATRVVRIRQFGISGYRSSTMLKRQVLRWWKGK